VTTWRRSRGKEGGEKATTCLQGKGLLWRVEVDVGGGLELAAGPPVCQSGDLAR
jgi:hypothetical protein